MPTYDMACNACEHVFEIRRSIKDDSPLPCPECGGETRHLISLPMTFSRNIDHPDSPLDDLPGAQQKRQQMETVVRKSLKDLGMAP